MAEVMGVSVPTLRHYFGDRSGVIDAVLGAYRLDSEEYLSVVRRPLGDFETSIRQLTEFVQTGFTVAPLAQIHCFGIAEGVDNDAIASSYLANLLEYVLEACAVRLQVHLDAGEMVAESARFAAICLLSPIFVTYLHQTGMGGSRDYPLDIPKFIHAHTEAFIRAYKASSA